MGYYVISMSVFYLLIKIIYYLCASYLEFFEI